MIRACRTLLSDGCQATREFFHAPIDARVVAALRIGYASLLLVNVICWWPDVEKWFSDQGVLTLAASRRTIDSTCLTLFQLLPADAVSMRAAYCLFVAQIVALLAGWKARWQAVCCYVWLVSFQHRNNLIFEGEDTLFRLFGFLLIFMPLDAAWSIHGCPKSPAEQPSPPLVDGWAVRLLQIEVATVFFSAAWSKLLGAPWRDGTALYYVMRLDQYWGRFPVPGFVMETPWIVRGLTWSTMGLEFAVPVLIWFAPTRRAALGLVLVFHLACDYAMHLFLFHWIMLVGWMAFVQPDDLTWVRRRLRLS